MLTSGMIEANPSSLEPIKAIGVIICKNMAQEIFPRH